ncbi:hypothetical protein KGY71_04510 [Candidatus Bipolaricaulota bacterium]|nr:hypothetical protein [Candidatus Bipolaricaulota bacterium]
MVEKITITVDGETFEAGLNDTDTAEAVMEVLPVEAEPSFWGEEIYFDIPEVKEENEEPAEKLDVGDLAYWPDGHAFCIFYGPTPNSEDTEPRPASPVTVIGSLNSEVSPLKELEPFDTEEVRVESR